jgi:hypothetical protein
MPPRDNFRPISVADYSGHTQSRESISRTTGVAVQAMLAADGAERLRLPSDREDRANIRALGYALSKLPPSERARWAEEWVSDLTSLDGRFAKLRLRLGIRLNGRRMGKQPNVGQANVPTRGGMGR